MFKSILYPIAILYFSLFLILSCNNAKLPESDLAKTPEELVVKASDMIRLTLNYATEHDGRIDDSVSLDNTGVVNLIYEQFDFSTLWSSSEKWNHLADSLRMFIAKSELYGLFPEDYHRFSVDTLYQKLEDTTIKNSRLDAVLWARADLLLTDAFVHIIHDLKLGRLAPDTVTMRRDTVLTDSFYLAQFQQIQEGKPVAQLFQSLEPQHRGYQQLKNAIPEFLDRADYKAYTKVPESKDSIGFHAALMTRLSEGGFLSADSLPVDSVTLSRAIKSFQKAKAISADGLVGPETIRTLNTTDKDKFVTIALTLDRYKMLPEALPSRHLWVNLPGYYLELVEKDSVLIYSKIICGKKITRTPLLTSAISEMITYPQWTIPESIIQKEILPAVKKDPSYLVNKGYSLIDGNGDEIDPFVVEWSRYKKSIPYKVVQGSGDENALGILKFNFPNKYYVYLHDTNQRYLFSRNIRSLSHGCVRVQEWDDLAYNIIRYDNREKYGQGRSPMEDSLTRWLAVKEKHRILVRNRLPLYIRYFTCEAREGRLIFYEDIYGEDLYLRELFFKGK